MSDKILTTEKRNSILIVMDQLISYHRLPKELLDYLPGYQAFKKKGIQFNNIYNNRQMCSPSRASFTTSFINHGIQDNIDVSYQYDYVPYLNENINTTGKIFKKNEYKTAYYGKQHYDSRTATHTFTTPKFCTNTRGAAKGYGYDVFNTYGDTYYFEQYGILGDSYALENINSPTATEFDYIDPISKNKLSGALPFLKARSQNKDSFYLEFHITNPHDTQHIWSNFSQIPESSQSQFGIPFLEEQINKYQVSNPYLYNEEFKNAIIKNSNLTFNFFEKNFKDYENSKDKLPFLNSLENDYPDNPTHNSINPFYVGYYYLLTSSFTNATNKTDLLTWKNLINNYYGLIIEADAYVYKVYNELVNLDLINNTNVQIISDHGDCMSSHGLKQKGIPFNNATNICCLIYSPDLNKDLINTESNILGSLIDVLPTFVELSNLNSSDKESNILGNPLLIRKNNELILNNTKKDSVFQVVNNNMLLPSYFTYKYWLDNVADVKQKRSVLYTPDSLFDYKFYYVMIIQEIEGIKYKYGRYFSMSQIVTYNIKHNKNLLNKTFSKEIFSDLIKTISPQILLTTDIITINKILPDFFTFSEGLNIIIKHEGSKDTVLSYMYFYFISDTLSNVISNIYYIPNVFNDFNSIKNEDITQLFCYNNTKDDDEVYNLLDPKNYSCNNDHIYTKLNQELNNQIKAKKCLNFYLIIPSNLMQELIKLVKLRDSIDFDRHNEQKLLKNFIYINGLNNLDSTLDTKTVVKLNNNFNDFLQIFIDKYNNSK